MAKYKKIVVPNEGEKITIKDGKLSIPDNPVIPFIEGDGTGPDIWFASKMVFDAAVEKAYNGKYFLVEVCRKVAGSAPGSILTPCVSGSTPDFSGENNLKD